MDAAIIDNSDPSELVLEVLTQHLPWSLPLLRRLQFMRGSGAKTSHSRVLSTFDKENPNREFLVASVDLSRGPETELWLYSSVENGGLPGNEAVCEKQVLRLFERVREMEKKFESRRPTPGVVLVATLHAKVLKMLEKHSMVKAKTEEHLKFIFQMGDLPEGKPLLEELAWSSVMPTDIPLVLSRTSIPYQAKTMERLPSMTITTKAGKLIAWVFLGLDGSLKALHCEEEYRGRGLAKAVTLRLLREKSVNFGHDGLSHADVAVGNLQSQGVCKSLNGKARWSVYFVWIDIS